jgi:hypothetical protein
MEKSKNLSDQVSQYLKVENNLKIGEKCLKYLEEKSIPEENYASFISDSVVSRFMKARDNKLEEAFNMWSGWVNWRLEYKPDEITEKDVKNELKTGKAFLHGCDIEGRPCIVVKNAKHIPENSDLEEIVRFFIYNVETACKLADEKGIKQICVIMDRENTGWANFDRRFLGKMNLATILQDYYAERLHAVYILHVNWIFRSIFAMVKPFVAENTKNKMKILGDVSELKNYFKEEDLLKEHGGSSQFVFEYRE